MQLQKDAFETKLAQCQTIEAEMDTRLQQGQELINQLKLDYADQIAQLKKAHEEQIKSLQIENENELKKKRSIAAKPKTIQHGESVNDIIEQALREFEQEQHQHLPSPIKPLDRGTSIQHYDSNKSSLKNNMLASMMMKNQQWYSQKYVPVNAVSWPTPKSFTHLKTVHQPQIC